MESKHDGMAMACDISHDARLMLSCSDLDNAVVIWDLRQEKSIKVMKCMRENLLAFLTIYPTSNNGPLNTTWVNTIYILVT